MHFVIAMMQHETNTFSSVPTPLSAFGRGPTPPGDDEAIGAFRDTNTPFAAFLDAVESLGAKPVVPVAAYAEPSQRVESEAFEHIAERICAAVSRGCDGILLDLHGAMVTQTYHDGEGELLERIRALDKTVPIAVALDFHANLTRRMVDNATVITGYRTYPHIDMYDTGARAARTLLAVIRGEVDPVIIWRRLPMITNMVCQGTASGTMHDLMQQALQSERDATVLNASVFGGFPLADIPYLGLSPVIVADRARMGSAQTLLKTLCQEAWERRGEFVFAAESVTESVNFAKQLGAGPIILAEHGDNCGAGGSQDGMDVIAEVMRQDLTNVAAGPVVDPEAVRQCAEAGTGANVTIAVGGKVDSPSIGLQGQPLAVTGNIKNITDGQFRIRGPMMTGCLVDLGRSVVLDTGTLELLITERRHEPYDLDFYRHAGIEPTAKSFLVLKSRHHFRAAFEPIAKHIVVVAGQGVCSENLSIYPFRNLEHPIYPLDLDTTFDFTSA